MKDRVLKSYNRQQFMKLLGAEMITINEGTVAISCEVSSQLTQQHGFLHAGVITTLMDVACGYAALSMMPEDKEVLSVEFKTNLLKACKVDKVMAVGKVVKAGSRLTFCEGRLMDEAEETLFATMTATMIAVNK